MSFVSTMLNLQTVVFRCCMHRLGLYRHVRHLNSLSPQTDITEKTIGTTKESQRKIIRLTPVQPENPHNLKVSIIGAPNAGKSTLANELIGWRFASVSKKVHTTRNNAIGILSVDNTQVVFLDTPGLTSNEKVKKHNLERSLLLDPYSSLLDTDLIITVVDVSVPWNRSVLDPHLLSVLTLHSDKKSILVLNKVDLVKHKRDLLTMTRLLTEGIIGGKRSPFHKMTKKKVNLLDNILQREGQQMKSGNIMDETVNEDKSKETYVAGTQLPSKKCEGWWEKYSAILKKTEKLMKERKGWGHFDDVFMISAINGDGVDAMKRYLVESANPGPWLYHKSMVTDQDPIELAKLCVREKLLDHLPSEIPYRIKLAVTLWEYDENNILRIQMNLVCQRRRDVVHVIGPGGNIISQISQEANQDLMNSFKQELSLILSVNKPNS